jgi:hypothetical protein
MRISIFFLLFFIIIFIFAQNTIIGSFIHNSFDRVLELFDFSSGIQGVETHTGRGILTVYAWFLGQYTGQGTGAFSDIYGIHGWKVDELLNSQLNISTLTNLLAEVGLIGLFAYIYIYTIFIISMFAKFKIKLFVVLLFFSALCYNRLLMDERIIYMFIFIVLLLKIYEINLLRKD